MDSGLLECRLVRGVELAPKSNPKASLRGHGVRSLSSRPRTDGGPEPGERGFEVIVLHGHELPVPDRE